MWNYYLVLMKPQLSKAACIVTHLSLDVFYPLFQKSSQDGYQLEALEQALVSANMCAGPLGNLDPLILSLLCGGSCMQDGQPDS